MKDSGCEGTTLARVDDGLLAECVASDGGRGSGGKRQQPVTRQGGGQAAQGTVGDVCIIMYLASYYRITLPPV
jgi:hypothetical protein